MFGNDKIKLAVYNFVHQEVIEKLQGQPAGSFIISQNSSEPGFNLAYVNKANEIEGFICNTLDDMEKLIEQTLFMNENVALEHFTDGNAFQKSPLPIFKLHDQPTIEIHCADDFGRHPAFLKMALKEIILANQLNIKLPETEDLDILSEYFCNYLDKDTTEDNQANQAKFDAIQKQYPQTLNHVKFLQSEKAYIKGAIAGMFNGVFQNIINKTLPLAVGRIIGDKIIEANEKELQAVNPSRVSEVNKSARELAIADYKEEANKLGYQEPRRLRK